MNSTALKEYREKNEWLTLDIFKAAIKVMTFNNTFQDITGSKV